MITRRHFLFAPILIATPAPAQVEEFLGELIIELFEKVVQVGISMLVESAAKYLVARYFHPPKQQIQTADIRSYIETGHAADNFCAFCTVENTVKGQRFWDGALFSPNEENRYYRDFNEATDQVLIRLLTDAEHLQYLDHERNEVAHFSPQLLGEIRDRVTNLEANKTRLYYGMSQKTLRPAQLDRYFIPRSVLREIDKQYKHVTTQFHRKREYVDSAIELQKFATWFNTKLAAVKNGVRTDELIALDLVKEGSKEKIIKI